MGLAYAVTLSEVDAKRVVAENLKRLMQLAAERGETQLASQNALSRTAKVGQRTVGRILARDQAAGVDTLEKLAAAFDLQAWHLLVPNMDVSNPPTILVTEAERELYRSLTAVVREYAADSGTQDPESEVDGPDRDPAGDPGKPARKKARQR